MAFKKIQPKILPEYRRRDGRPGPTKVNSRGLDVWRPAELAAYRQLAGISQDEVATELDITQPYVARLETDWSEPDERQAVGLLDAVDAIKTRRERIMERGRTLADALAAGTYVEQERKATVRTAAESRAILEAQGRLSEA